jgi:hypothetical protein
MGAARAVVGYYDVGPEPPGQLEQTDISSDKLHEQPKGPLSLITDFPILNA